MSAPAPGPHASRSRPSTPRDHGGGIDAAMARWGGERDGWIDLSTGINPVPYPIPDLSPGCWTALPDRAATARITQAARSFWGVPDGAGVLAAPGASALIARLPAVTGGPAHIPAPTYNEHAAAFRAAGHDVASMDTGQPVRVLVHPNNPDGRLWSTSDVGAAEAGMAGSSKTGISRAGSSRTHGHPQRSQPSGAPHSGGTRRAFAAPDWTIIDESFCDVVPGASHISAAARPGVVVLKSFGKFWGLAGLRLGFAAATPDTLSRLAEMLGPWPVSGPALEIGARALEDSAWAKVTRDRLGRDADRLDRLMQGAGARVAGGTTLFRLYEVEDAAHWQDRLGRAHILSRVFPYAPHWLRLGLPAPRDWPRVEAALC